MKRRLREDSTLFAFGTLKKETNAKKSLKVFINRANDKELDAVANSLRRISNKAINLFKVDGKYDIVQFKSAVDLLKPEMLQTFFGEMKQSFPNQIDYNPFAMEPEDVAAMQEPTTAPTGRQAPAPEPEPEPAPEEEEEPQPQTVQERKMLKLKRLVELFVRKEMKKILK